MIVGRPVTTCHPGFLGLPCFGLDPTTVTCPFCQNRVTTRVLPRFEPITKCDAFWFACLCCYLCKFRDIKHVCPNCNRILGMYEFGCC